MKEVPTVSVVMPMFNAETTIVSAIESILSQSFGDFELLVIDDVSTDRSVEMVRSISDERIQLIHCEVNIGVANALNQGLKASTGKYIARMDADDISLPSRFAKQVSFLDTHPEISICGTFAETFGAKQVPITHPTEPEQLRCALIFDTCFAHPTVMFRRQDFEQHSLAYDTHVNMEDFDLWVRALDILRGANISEYLLKYRISPSSVTQTWSKAAVNGEFRALDTRALMALGISPGEHELKMQHVIRQLANEPYNIEDVEEYLLQLLQANDVSRRFPRTDLSRSLGWRWYLANHYLPGAGVLKYPRFVNSKLYSAAGVTPKQTARFLARYRPPWPRS